MRHGRAPRDTTESRDGDHEQTGQNAHVPMLGMFNMGSMANMDSTTI